MPGDDEFALASGDRAHAGGGRAFRRPAQEPRRQVGLVGIEFAARVLARDLTFHVARVDRGATHPAPGELDRQRLADGAHRRLGRHVRRASRHRHEAEDAPEQDHPALAFPDEWQGVANRGGKPEHVGLELAAPRLRSERVDGAALGKAGVGHDDVDAIESLHHLGHCGCQVAFARDVAGNHQALGPAPHHFSRNLLQALAPAPRQRHPGSLVGKAQGQGRGRFRSPLR